MHDNCGLAPGMQSAHFRGLSVSHAPVSQATKLPNQRPTVTGSQAPLPRPLSSPAASGLLLPTATRAPISLAPQPAPRMHTGWGGRGAEGRGEAAGQEAGGGKRAGQQAGGTGLMYPPAPPCTILIMSCDLPPIPTDLK